MKRIATFLSMCALLAGLSGIAGCKNDTAPEPQPTPTPQPRPNPPTPTPTPQPNPQTPQEPQKDGYNWYFYALDVSGESGDTVNFLVSSGNGEPKSQDMTNINKNAKKLVYEWDINNAQALQISNRTGYPTQSIDNGKLGIYVYTNAQKVNVHAWGSAGNLTGKWPGQAMNRLTNNSTPQPQPNPQPDPQTPPTPQEPQKDGYNWYFYALDVSSESGDTVNFLISSGNGEPKSQDMTNINKNAKKLVYEWDINNAQTLQTSSRTGYPAQNIDDGKLGIYVYSNAQKVNVHAWGSAGNLTGEWPGATMNRLTNNSTPQPQPNPQPDPQTPPTPQEPQKDGYNWYFYALDVSGESGDTVNFLVSSGNGEPKSQDMTNINKNAKKLVYEWDINNAQALQTSSRTGYPTQNIDNGKLGIYVYTNAQKVNVHAWGSAGNLTGKWPGATMNRLTDNSTPQPQPNPQTPPTPQEPQKDGYNWYFYALDVSSESGDTVNFLISSGNGEPKSQDMTNINKNAKKLVYEWDINNAQTLQTSSRTGYPAQNIDNGKLGIYVYTNAQKVNVHAWGSAGNLTGEWPGATMNRLTNNSTPTPQPQPNPQPNPPTPQPPSPPPPPGDMLEEGVYIGLLSFDSKTHELTDSLVKLDKDGKGKAKLRSLLDKEYKSADASGTLLYYTVHKTLSKLQADEARFPQRTKSYNIITFTDGLDQGSTDPALWEAAPIDGQDFGGGKGQGYLSWLHGQLETAKIKGQPVTASAYGVKGNDITGSESTENFKKNLAQLKTTQGEVDADLQFYSLGDKFKKIADGLTVVTKHTSFNLLITPPEVGTVFKMTFDYLYGNNPDSSNIFFTGTYHYDDSTKEYALKDIAYTGINCDQKFVKGTRNGLEPVKFHFAGFNLAGDKEIHKEYIKQWYKAPNISSWQLNSEYKQDNTTDIKVDRHSAIIYLVLDSSKSLSSSDVSTVRNAAKAFIDKLQERYHKKY